ncbi:MAG: 2-oxo-4-hydroxy-4-carboxy-5-ureidoimidazoline decarboxylase [Cyanobacteria bacterium J06623_5]
MNNSIEAINQMTQAEFVQRFGHIFEETPTVAKTAWTARPFTKLDDLHKKMVAVVHRMSPAEKLALIRAHPELGAKAEMADASVQEQASAGLNRLNAKDYQKIQTLNAAYKEKFGFPFVVAVKGMSVKDVIAAMETRVGSEREEEVARSLAEIYKIARFRLESTIEC